MNVTAKMDPESSKQPTPRATRHRLRGGIEDRRTRNGSKKKCRDRKGNENIGRCHHSTLSTRTLMRPPQESPTRHAVSSATPNSRRRGRRSTKTTCTPMAARIEAYSAPMTPPPMMAISDHIHGACHHLAFDATARYRAKKMAVLIDCQLRAGTTRRRTPCLDHGSNRHPLAGLAPVASVPASPPPAPAPSR